MKMKFAKILTVAAGLAAMGTMSHAITLNDGGFVCEGPLSLLQPGADCSGGVFGDAGNTTNKSVELGFSGSGTGYINGGVRGADTTNFADAFDITGTGEYLVTVTAMGFNPSTSTFDATWSMGGVEVGTLQNIAPAVTSLTTKINLGAGGTTVFELAAQGGAAANGSFMPYQVTIAAVPLPAGVLLLLSALGGLGLMRRRATA